MYLSVVEDSAKEDSVIGDCPLANLNHNYWLLKTQTILSMIQFIYWLVKIQTIVFFLFSKNYMTYWLSITHHTRYCSQTMFLLSKIDTMVIFLSLVTVATWTQKMQRYQKG